MYYMLFISVFEETELIAIVYRIVQGSDFARLFISFKYGLILLRYSSITCFIFISITFIFNLTSAPKIKYWFIIIQLSCSKKVHNISNYSVFDCFIFCLKRFLILLIVLPSISFFFSLKSFFTSLLVLSSLFFYLFQALTIYYFFLLSLKGLKRYSMSLKLCLGFLVEHFMVSIVLSFQWCGK